MNDQRFDALTEHIGILGTRRHALGALLGGALGVFGLAPPDTSAARSGKCKRQCGECEKCKRGDCKKTNGKKRCKPGKCKPKPAGTPCSAFAGGACQNGTCVDLAADETNCGSVGA